MELGRIIIVYDFSLFHFAFRWQLRDSFQMKWIFLNQ